MRHTKSVAKTLGIVRHLFFSPSRAWSFRHEQRFVLPIAHPDNQKIKEPCGPVGNSIAIWSWATEKMQPFKLLSSYKPAGATNF